MIKQTTTHQQQTTNMRYEAICYSFTGSEVDHSPFLPMPALAEWLQRAVTQLPGIERIVIEKKS